MNKIFYLLLYATIISAPIIFPMNDTLSLPPTQSSAERGLCAILTTHITASCYSPEQAKYFIVLLGLVNKELSSYTQEPAVVRTFISNLSHNYNKQTVAKEINTPGSRQYLIVNDQLFNTHALNEKQIAALIEKGADINYLPEQPCMPSLLMRAATHHPAMVTYLLKQGAFINLEVDGSNPLKTALTFNNDKSVENLISYTSKNDRSIAAAWNKFSSEDLKDGLQQFIEKKNNKMAQLFITKGAAVPENYLYELVKKTISTDLRGSSDLSTIVLTKKSLQKATEIINILKKQHTPLQKITSTDSFVSNIDLISLLCKQDIDSTSALELAEKIKTECEEIIDETSEKINSGTIELIMNKL